MYNHRHIYISIISIFVILVVCKFSWISKDKEYKCKRIFQIVSNFVNFVEFQRMKHISAYKYISYFQYSNISIIFMICDFSQISKNEICKCKELFQLLSIFYNLVKFRGIKYTSAEIYFNAYNYFVNLVISRRTKYISTYKHFNYLQYFMNFVKF